MKTTLILPLLALLIFSCNSKEKSFEQKLSEEDVARVELGKLNLSIKVPKTHELREFGGGNIEFDGENITDQPVTHLTQAVIDLNPNRRYVKQLIIAKSSAITQKVDYSKTYSFENDATLGYETSVEDGGSGGAEHILVGILKFGGDQFLITASDQDELGYADPTFCLKYLSTLERVE